MQLLLAAMLLGMSRASRWKSHRWLALVALWGGLLAVVSLVFTVEGLTERQRELGCRLAVSFSALHVICWLWFLKVEEERECHRYEKGLILAGQLAAVVALVPGALVDGRVSAHRVSWLGGATWYDVQATPLGWMFFVGYLAALAFVAVRVARDPRHGLSRAVMLFALLAGQLNDAIASTAVVELPYVGDLAYLATMVLVAAVVTREALSSASALDRSSERLAAAQAELVRRERLAALGELSAVVAHEVRNPLGVVFNGMARLKQLVEPGSETAVLLRAMNEEAERLDRLVGDLLDLTRMQPIRRQPAQLGELVEAAVTAARHAWTGQSADVALDVQPGLSAADVDAEQVRRAVVNLVTNALQATRRTEPIRVRVFSDGPKRQRVEVSDDGPGVPEEHRARVFTPFFTTRAQGTGLGLAVVQRVAEAHGGEVAVGTSPSGGAVFSLVLPVSAP